MRCLRFTLRISFVTLVLMILAMMLLFESQRRGKTIPFSSSSESLSDLIKADRQETLIHPSFQKSKTEQLEFDCRNPFTLSPDPQEPARQTSSLPDSPERRRSLLLFGADRSGTTFISRMFSEDPQMFMIYEPLWVTKYWKNKLEGNWTNSELEVLSGILSCKFADFPRATQFLAHTSKNWAAAPFKNPFQSSNFCNVSESGVLSCPDLSSVPRFAEHVCSTKYKHSVTKVAQVRAPRKMLWNLVPKILMKNPDTDIRVLQILRDPRGSLNSRIKLGWMPNYTSPYFVSMVREPCKNIATNVKYGRNLPEQYKQRYMEVYYRDIAMSPVKTAQKIYSFAGFELSEDLIKWIVFNTSPSEQRLAEESKKAFSSVRNSNANVDKWRQTAPEEQVRIIERECNELMQLLGL